MKILIVGPRLLVPTDTGGKIRSLNLFRELAKDHEVVYLTFFYPNDKEEYVKAVKEHGMKVITVEWQEASKSSPKFYWELLLNLLSAHPYIMQKYHAPIMVNKIKEELAKGDYDVVLCDFLQSYLNLQTISNIPVVLFQHNVEAKIVERLYPKEKNLAKKLYLYLQWRKLRRTEKKVSQQVDYVITVSEQDKLLTQQEYQVSHVEDIPTGVDLEFFQPFTPPQNHRLIFTGSMDWRPNEDAMLYFCDQVLPLVQQQLPDAALTIVGKNPSATVKQLAQAENIQVTGRVPDIRPYIRESQVYIVPLRIGGGTRIKIFEAMAMGIPVVSTSIGAEGLPVDHEKNIFLCDDPQSFAQAIIDLCQQPELHQKIARNSRELVQSKYGWQQAAAKMAELLQRPQK